ncbi:uncharacterized protein LOC110773081 [Prunus avium]|uniref:Uncharacterized protein LOC110773081 n=1 Tax=Prunus avium TaxID=42229 RepID=A0A6P5U1N2_PRUAV|nr:uncharacterized protein LOC110773081 [Prunus avium]
MTPAAVDFRSPITSIPTKPSSTPENPNPVPDVASSPTFNLGASNDNGSQCQFGPSVPSRLGRSRPRFVKMRKQHSRSRTGSGESGPGVNPFCSVSDGTSSSNGFNFSNGDCGGVDFVFGARKIGGDENLDNGEGESGGIVRNLDNGEGGSSEIMRNSSCDDNLDNGEGECCEKGKILSCDETGQVNTGNGRGSDKLESVCYECSAKQDGLGSSLCREKREFCENVKAIVSEDKWNEKTETETECQKGDNRGFVFSANSRGLSSDLQLDSNHEMRECGGYVEKPSTDNSGKMKIESEVGYNVGSGLGASQRDSAPKLNAENGESASFVFVTGLDDFGSTSNTGNRKHSENEGTPGCDGIGSTEIDNEAEEKKYNDMGFVFGSSWNSLNSGNKSSSGKLEKLAPDVGGKMKVESETEFEKMEADPFKFHAEERCISNKDHDKGFFVFGSSTKKGSSLTECKVTKCQDEMKLSSENLGDCKTNSESNSCGQCSGGPYVASEKNNGDNDESSDQNHIFFESDRNTKGATIGISGSKKFTSQAGSDESVEPGQFSHYQIKNDTHPNVAAAPCSSSSIGPGIKTNGCVSEAASVGGVRKKDENSSTGFPDGFGVCFEDLKTSFLDPSCLRTNLFPELNKTLEFSVKGRSFRDKRSRKQRGKSKLSKQWPVQDHVPKESSSQGNPDASGCYSPMDFSPYEETRVADPHSRETSVASTDSFHLVNDSAPCASNAAVPADPKGEDLVAAGSGLDDRGDRICKEPIEENSRSHGEKIFFHDFLWKGSGSGAEPETPCFSSKSEHVSSISGAGLDSEEARVGIGLNIESQESDCKTPLFASGFENMKDKYFTFLASSSTQGSSMMTKRQQRRKKNRMKVGHETFVITPSPNVEFGSSDLFTLHSKEPLSADVVGKSEANEQFKQVNISSSAATHETCEKWRLRGNEAYKNEDLSKAEDFYTQGIISIPSNERSGCCLKPLLLCYSNRAAARMVLGRIREALGDCVMATALDPNFLKVQMRAANCHLLLGEVEIAQQYFNKCSESGSGVCLDRRVVIDSADGLQKVQKVVEYTNRSAKLLDQRTTDAALTALEIISEALSVSLYSETLLEMKAEALCLLRRYEEAVQLCEQSLFFAERNFAPLNNVRLWRWFFISKSYFHLGRLEAALDLLEKLEEVESTKVMYASKKLELAVSLAVTIRELLSHKNAGNEAFRSGRYAEALEHYTVALSSNFGSRPFSAICLCNRGAAHQALGQITDAIADCSLAIALDGNYVKAVSRRATLHEMIRDYGQAASDLQRLISILENQSNDKAKECSSKGRSNGSVKELRHAHRRMPSIEEEAKKGISLDFYLILGIKPSDASPDIKKAYRKAALKHHPDKAGQFLARSESGDEGQLWKEISQEVHKDADRLFKMIGEAYAVLSDPAKRSQYDLEEEMRKVEIESKESGIYRKSSDFQSPGRNSYRRPDFHSSPFERSSNSRTYGRENWRTYGNSYSRW